jgi:bacterioferritin
MRGAGRGGTKPAAVLLGSAAVLGSPMPDRKRLYPITNRNVSDKSSSTQKGASDSSASTADGREQLIDGLNEDLSREYQAIIAYVAYSQAIKGAQYMNIAKELEKHAAQELQHALIIAKQIDYLGGDIGVQPKPVKTSDKVVDMLRFDLQNEEETIRCYRERVRQCEALGEYAIAEHIREILLNEQEHLTDLATALGEDPPNLSQARKSAK